MLCHSVENMMYPRENPSSHGSETEGVVLIALDDVVDEKRRIWRNCRSNVEDALAASERRRFQTGQNSHPSKNVPEEGQAVHVAWHPIIPRQPVQFTPPSELHHVAHTANISRAKFP